MPGWAEVGWSRGPRCDPWPGSSYLPCRKLFPDPRLPRVFGDERFSISRTVFLIWHGGGAGVVVETLVVRDTRVHTIATGPGCQAHRAPVGYVAGGGLAA